MLDVKRFLDSPLHLTHQTCKSSQLIFLNVFKHKMYRVLRLLCRLNTHTIFKTFSFRFLCDYYGDSVDVMLHQFPNHFLPLPTMFQHGVSALGEAYYYIGVSTVSLWSFLRFLFQVLRLNSLLNRANNLVEGIRKIKFKHIHDYKNVKSGKSNTTIVNAIFNTQTLKMINTVQMFMS